MSGDVQPRKRKEKRRKKDSEEIPSNFSSDEQLHVHKDASTGGNICAKILFFLLSFVLLVMIGLVVFEYRGSADDETLVPVSKWASTFDGWLESPVKHDEHAEVTESGEQEHGESGEHENESAEGEEHLSEEAASKEEDEDEEEEEETKESEEEETKSAEEEEEDEDEGSNKLEDEGSEEVDENEIEETEDTEEEDEDDEQEEGSEEDVYEHGKSEEDMEAEKDDDEGDEEEEDAEEDEDAESGREQPDDDDEEAEREGLAYGRESDEIDDLLNEIPGITESDEDEEGDNLGRSEEIIGKQQKIPGVQEKKVKTVSEEEADQPRRKQEKEVSGSTQPVEATSTVKVGQKPHEQIKHQDQDNSKTKAHQSVVKQKDVTEKSTAVKHEKPKAIHPQDELSSKSGHQAHRGELPAMKNNGFPSGPGEAGQGQKAEALTPSKVAPSKKQKEGIEATKDGSSKPTLPKKQKDDAGPTLKSEHIPADHSKPVVSAGKNFKDKDVSSDGVNSPPKASRVGDKIEQSLKGGKSSTLHKVTEQSSPTKLDVDDRVSVSKSAHVDKSAEEQAKPVNSKDKQGTKPVHSASDPSVKNINIDGNDVRTTGDNNIKRSDLKADAHATLETAKNLKSVDKTVTPDSNAKGKENMAVESKGEEPKSLNSQTKQAKSSRSTDEKKQAGKKENFHKNEDQLSKQEKNNVEHMASNLDHHAETVRHVDAKDSRTAKSHEDLKKSKVVIEKQKAASSSREKVPDTVSSEVPVSTAKVREVRSDNLNAARKKSSVDNTTPEVKHNSEARDTKVTPEITLKHSVRKEDDGSKTREVKSNVQSAASHKNTHDEELRPVSASETRAGHQENGGNNKPGNPNLQKPSHSRKVSSPRIEKEVTQSKSDGSSREKAAPSQRNSNSETVT